MGDSSRSRVKDIFLEALELEGRDREALLRARCGDDEQLRRQVLDLLRANDAVETAAIQNPLLDAQVEVGVEALDSDDTPGHRAGDAAGGLRDNADAPLPEKIGSYRIRRRIGAGGMGTVYEGVQENPRRIVAIKVMRDGLRSRAAVRRFEYECEVLARLRHPGIAKIHEAGTHQRGDESLPYFVMEYVADARAITTYAKEERLDLRDRLGLFLQVCAAVHHGHQKGVIHRDIKPDNVLVDGSGHAQLIDFGVARTIDPDQQSTTMRTGQGQIVGTLQYMSPEQVGPDSLDIDTRSDVYALGVLLYLLVTDRMPYEVSGSDILAAIRVITEKVPARLSETDTRLRGDLETIVQKAMEKDRTRRYQSAEELRSDVVHFLEARPITARPPSVIYQIRVFARRNRALFGSAVAIVLMLVFGSIFLAVQYLRAEDARRVAVRAGEEADAQRGIAVVERDRARDAEKLAESRRAEAEAINQCLSDMLASVTPDQARGEEVAVRDILDRVAETVDTEFVDAPHVRATLHRVIGETYGSLGIHERATSHAERAYQTRLELGGPDDPVTLHCDVDLGALARMAGDYEQAEERLERAAAGLVAVVGKDDERTLNADNELATLYTDLARFDEARDLFEDVIDRSRRVLGPLHSFTLLVENNLGVVYLESGDAESAERHIRELLALRRKADGDLHPETLACMNNLALALTNLGRFDEVEELYRKVTADAAVVFGDGHPWTLTTRNNLGMFLMHTGNLTEAEAILRDMLNVAEKELGPGRLETLGAEQNLAGLLMRRGEREEAAEHFRNVITMRRRVQGDEHPDVLMVLNNYAGVGDSLGRGAEVDGMYEELLLSRTDLLGEDHVETLAVGFHIGTRAQDRGDLDRAEELFRKAVAAWRRERPDAWRTYGMQMNLGSLLTQRRQFEEAEIHLLEAHAGIIATIGESHSLASAAAGHLVTLYGSMGKPDEVRKWRAHAR